MESNETVSRDMVFEVLCRNTRALSVALGYRDLMTRFHSERVCELAMMLGSHAGIDGHESDILKMAASFHDIGKIGIPDHILMKPAPLDETEWAAMKQHAQIGEQIILSSEFRDSRQAAHAIRHHHEHFNGQGYPDGLTGEEIPLYARIIAIADSYDAMAVTRAYHHARRHDEIMEVLHDETEEKFDPRLMEIFSEQIARSPLRAE